MKALCISAICSNSGKTTLMTALLYHFKNRVRPFKIGPDFIDPQFHQSICQTPSINLDSFMMNSQQVQWMFQQYHDKEMALLEGVMGFYDGMDKGSSAYDVSKQLHVPTVLLLDGSGSYITISAVLKGLKEYKTDNTIKAVVLNKLSSSMHYELIKNQILKDFDDVVVLGWIEKNLPSLESTYLGLDLSSENKERLESMAQEVLQHIDLEPLETVAQMSSLSEVPYCFETIKQTSKTLAVVHDENFSFLYHDNIQVLKDLFKEVIFVNACNNESIPSSVHAVFIPGGYVETFYAYEQIQGSTEFKNSLIQHAQSKPIYAECAGLLYLSKAVDNKKMSGILNLEFTLGEKRERLGYYYNGKGVKGHAFHYTKPLNAPEGVEVLSKRPKGKGKTSAWRQESIYGSYLHIMFRNNISTIKEYFGI